MSKDFNSDWLFDIYNYNKRIYLIVSIISIVVFSILAYLLPSEYRATVILFPASNESVSYSVFAENSQTKGITRFGENEEVEYFLQVLNSDEIKDYITKRFNLYEHYNIDTLSYKYPKTKLTRKWENNVSFRKTEFLSIEIEVFDHDPKYAANMANAIAEYADTLMNKIKHERSKKAYEIVKKEYFDALAQLQYMQDSIQKIRKLGVINYDAQSEVYSDAYAQALAKGNMQGAKLLEEKFRVLSEYGGIYQTFDEMLTYEAKRIVALKEKYIQAKVDAEQFIPYKFIVSKADIPEKEYYPIRWLIIVGGLLSSWLLLTVILAFMIKKKKFNYI
ncbi:MAG: hypothetical protein N2449_09055 [Bacteroidales bacterium]|nr:hypothetical protein [Bacteroidales bacterium]